MYEHEFMFILRPPVGRVNPTARIREDRTIRAGGCVRNAANETAFVGLRGASGSPGRSSPNSDGRAAS